MAAEPGSAAHWDEAYAHGDTMRSWFQATPEMSLRMLDAAGVTAASSVIDVGGGASALVAALLERGFQDVTVLDREEHTTPNGLTQPFTWIALRRTR
jgi:protein-L-isoaspartate O-methyltransferase